MEDFIHCSVCKEFLLEGNAYGYVYKEVSGDTRLYYGHEKCLQKLAASLEKKKLLVHPAAFNKNDPLYIGYVGEKESGK